MGKPLMVFLMIALLALSSVLSSASAITIGGSTQASLVKSDTPSYTRHTSTSPGAMRVCGDHMCAPFENPIKSIEEVEKQNRTTIHLFNKTSPVAQTTIVPTTPVKEQVVTYAAPIVVNDLYTTTQSGILDVHSPGILENDNATKGKTLTAILIKDVRNGTLILQPSGGFTYIPSVKFYGDDSFQYSASDGSQTSVGTVTITVQRHVPLSQDDSYSLDENSTLTVSGMGVLENDSSSSGKPLNAKLVTNVEHGNLTLGQNGSFTYTPNPKFHGFDSFTYKANDGTVSGNISTVTLQIMTALPTSDNPLMKLIQQEIKDLKNQFTKLESRVHQLELNAPVNSTSGTQVPPPNPNFYGD